MNKAYIAHIVADSPNGPRGDDVRSPLLANDLSNLMLLCDGCHRLIDKVDVAGHPETLLVEFKREHEQRVETLTGIQPDLRTHVLTFVANIGERKGVVNRDDALQAVVPARHPDPRFLEIDLTRLSISDDDPGYWNQMRSEVESQLALTLQPSTGAAHVSSFALAPIPLLMVFGRKLGDIREADVFQKFRGGHPWKWRTAGGQRWQVRRARRGLDATEVAVAVSVTGLVHAAEVTKALGRQVPLYRIGVNRRDFDVVCTKQMLAEFTKAWRNLLNHIRATHGEDSVAHVFPATPNSIAVEMGRGLLPKSHPKLEVWDYQRDSGGYVHALSL